MLKEIREAERGVGGPVRLWRPQETSGRSKKWEQGPEGGEQSAMGRNWTAGGWGCAPGRGVGAEAPRQK